MRMRYRDYVATILVAVLGRIVYTYTSGSESLVVSISLAFYTNFTASEYSNSKRYNILAAKPVPFDVDGDGITEALIVPSVAGKSHWVLKILDLKPLHNMKTGSNNDIHSLPFYPKTLFSSKPIMNEGKQSQTRIPIHITTGLIIFRKNSGSPKGGSVTNTDTNASDRTRHFYCGRDWNDAASKCAIHCTGSSNSECPKGEICYADTPCDALAPRSDLHKELVKTPMPSIATVWSNGDITLHSVTADWPTEENTAEIQDRLQPELELREMWRIDPFIDNDGKKTDIDFEELDIILDSNTPIGEHGAVIVAARYRPIGTGHTVTSYHAIDAFNGKKIWTHKGQTPEEREMLNVKKIKDDATFTKPLRFSSSARRKSRLFSSAMDTIGDPTTSEECLHNYRHWIMHPSANVLPHMFWDPIVEQGAIAADSKLSITHFDRNHHYRTKKNGIDSKTTTPLYARPNVAIFHNRNGVDVVSLRNGRHVCHLSLFSSGLYADINNDGIVDHLQVVTDSWMPSSYGHSAHNTLSHDQVSNASDELAAKMAKRVQDSKPEHNVKTRISEYQLCHALLLSGIPAREELFSISLCESKSSRRAASRIYAASSIHAAPPLLMETYDINNGHPRHDIVFALSNGMVKRYDSHGQLRWSIGPNAERLPLWDSEHADRAAGFLGHIDFKEAGSARTRIDSTMKPILLAGNDGMSILSSKRGKILAHTSFLQSSTGRPILSDMSGDGTTDILITSVEGLWGYRVIVEQGGSIFIRIMIYLLMLGFAVAAICQQQSGQDFRSSDGGKIKIN